MTTLFLLATLLASPGSAKTIPVELGKEFRLTKADVASIEGGRATLRIVKFIYSPCPKGARCVWSGLAVITELSVDGKVVPDSAKDRPYDVTVKDSDYKTWAVLVVDKPEAACFRPNAGHPGECLRSLARRRKDPALCRKIEDERTRGFCLEDLAEELRMDALCAEVAAPSQYCLYLKAKASGDVKACEGIVKFDWRELCVKELSTPRK